MSYIRGEFAKKRDFPAKINGFLDKEGFGIDEHGRWFFKAEGFRSMIVVTTTVQSIGVHVDGEPLKAEYYHNDIDHFKEVYKRMVALAVEYEED